MSKTRHKLTLPDDLAPERLKAALALADGESDTAAARAAGVSRATLYAWMRDPAFEATVNTLRRDLFNEAWAERRRRSRELVEAANKVIRRTLRDKDAPIAVRAKVALAVLERFDDPPCPSSGPMDPEQVASEWAELDDLASNPFAMTRTLHKPALTAGEASFVARVAERLDALPSPPALDAPPDAE